MKKVGEAGLVKFTVLFFIVSIFASCSKHMAPMKSSALTQPQSTTTVVAEKSLPQEQKIALDETPVQMDTLVFPMRTRISSIQTNNSYFDKKVRSKSTEFYTHNGYHTRWLGATAPGSLYYAFIDIIKNSNRYGLRPAEYPIQSINEKIQSLYTGGVTDAKNIYDLDAQLTDVYFLLTTHLIEGRIRNTNNGDKIWIKGVGKGDDVTALITIADSKQLTEAIEKLHPVQEQYAKLQNALEQYRAMENNVSSNVKTIYVTGKIKPNDIHEAIPLIRRKLSLTDWKLDSLMLDSMRYDETLVSSIKWFQTRHGLEADGIIGAGTIKFLNQSFREKAELIELNLERMRWLPETYGENYIIVNVPEYKLRVYENQKLGLEMKVIVGAQDKATPIFSDTLKYIVFSPTWSVPNSIVRDEIIPRLQRDSAYYSSKNYTFYKNGVEFNPASVTWKNQTHNSYNYSVVQQPGGDNSLGRAKFIMPNKMSIYLHDTPNHNLFNRTNRALSHGCVRLDDPDKLAEYLLRDQRGWTMTAIDKAMMSEQTQTVFLKKPYHVQIEYRTAWVDDDGLVNFRDDIYGHDKKQLAQLRVADDKVASK